MKIAVLAGVGAAAGALGMAIALRPKWERWGATDEEMTRRLPGDYGDPTNATSNHAVTIDAPMGYAWQWLVQIGQDRAGFYSYDFLENLVRSDIHNRFEIRPEWQRMEKGDFIRSVKRGYMGGRVPEDTQGWRVADVEPGHWFVLEGWGTFYLEPIDGQSTRFIIRSRPGELTVPKPLELPFSLLHFLMERKMMLTIKRLAEHSWQEKELRAEVALTP
ncbi:MAG TPA: hypothetical protein VFY90_07670 [Tepidiformaceae bacterium]|nr:hypothetical protein [Tepidiformaceae bacterium]